MDMPFPLEWIIKVFQFFLTAFQQLNYLSDVLLSLMKILSPSIRAIFEEEKEESEDQTTQQETEKSLITPLKITDLVLGGVNTVAHVLAENKDDVIFTFVGSFKGNGDNINLNCKGIELGIKISGYDPINISPFDNQTVQFEQ